MIESSKSGEDLELQTEIDEVVGQVYSRVRTINIHLHEVENLKSLLSRRIKSRQAMKVLQISMRTTLLPKTHPPVGPSICPIHFQSY